MNHSEKEGQRRKRFLAELRAQPIYDAKRALPPTPEMPLTDLPGKLGFPTHRKPSQPEVSA